jgi:hypothetical protein
VYAGLIVAQTSRQAPERHDFLDHVWGWSQFGGALLAAVALVIALISARDSKRSADAAEKSAKAADRTAESTIAATAKEELELVKEQMNRRPILRLQVDTIGGSLPSERSPHSIAFSWASLTMATPTLWRRSSI